MRKNMLILRFDGRDQHSQHDKVSILDGGLPRWEAEGLPIDKEIPTHVNPHDVEQENKKFHPIMSEIVFATKPRIESYFIADVRLLLSIPRRKHELISLADLRRSRRISRITKFLKEQKSRM